MSDASTLPAGLKGLTADSRAVRPGYLFAALPGARADGRGFIADALAAGAAAILAPEGTVLPPGATATLVTDANPRRRLALMAAGFYRLQPATIAAVTGTSGKTSTVNFARQLWTLLGHQAASVGTLGVMAPGRERYGSLTTPDPVALHAELADLAASGVTKLAMEASSHGLDQFRLDGVRVTLAAFTNFTQDHLDYHPTMAEYLAAKARLFDQVLQPGGTAVINADIPEAPGLVARARGAGREVLTFGRAGQDFRMDRAEPLPHGIDLVFTAGGRSFRAELSLVGGFQAYNVLCALALVVADGADLATAAGLLSRLKGIPGRVELVASHPNGAPVYVDYSHKPGALETVLTALRAHTPGALVVVFGCGGDRDKGKRPLMGEIAARFADRVIVTDDNPRSEQPAEIRRQVMAGCPGATEIGDRAEAIRAAVEGLGPGDVLVVAGKGHETGQIIGDEVRPFDDAEQARQAVTHVKSDPRWRRTP
ncbi:UDP-N-acetylmuramoyl-L-alanyl-D-glutamate--2,6-diaminopimelate ligase [Inquilinus ginsengisoli]|uniref:UDP-N-acetylmuramoyl-L-alanyl-D-glutamate--2,6-diaminopimelate ligase n=1 Tax=Inquilinus ginsengisoli TaxID=363840 RepID=A0ABU1JIY7_9PROT|nr:UDP-N-acetylmuramoyl-L-alanyl-D-glutamate--2,6-diaminopimelate ligase [Inquilinus ginsengisoli]MDR6287999.1 UDP-N-acetylmuramoyl-L-alanyl-D-glutamate--2,6-diaminopimelate ligase [Inquilinus ginsengisoli]